MYVLNKERQMTKILKKTAAVAEWSFFPVTLIVWLTYTLSKVPM